MNRKQENSTDAMKLPKRFRIRFGLMTMLLAMTLAAIVIGFAIGKPARLAAATKFLQQTKTEYETAREFERVPKWQNWLFGEENLRPITEVRIYNKTEFTADYWARFRAHTKAMPSVHYLRIENVVVNEDTKRAVKILSSLKTFTCSDCNFEISTADLTALVDPDFIYLENSGFDLEDAIFLRNKFPQTFVVVVGADSNTD